MAEQIKKIAFWVLMGFLALCAGVYLLFPETVGRCLPLRGYVVLSESMEPTIPTFSLVLVRQIPEDAPLALQPEQIVTFRANRFGEEITETHRFSHTEWDEEQSRLVYRTHPDGTTDLDRYKTVREDIVGTYLLHIPFLGKVVLFLKSPWALVLLGEEVILFLINRLVRAHWKEQEMAARQVSAAG